MQNITIDKQLKKNAKTAAFFSIFAWLVLGIWLEDIALSLAASLLCGAGFVALAQYLPKRKRRQHALLVESQLPFTLLDMAIELNLGLKFEKILEHASSNKNEISKEFAKILKEIREQGSSIQEAMFHFSERIDSLEVKRAIALFVSVYEQGSGKSGNSLKMLARELLAKQRAQSKEFAGKLVVYSLLFVAVSAVIPALFQSFAIVGSMVLHLSLTATQIFLIIVVGFPLADIVALYFIRAKTPIFLRGG